MNKQRYTLAVYLLLATLSVILILVALNYYQGVDPVQGLLLNLGTELAGTVVIFFIVNQLFLLDRDDDVLKEIKSLKDQVQTKFNPMRSGGEASYPEILENYLVNARSVDLLGYNLASLLKYSRDALLETARKGAKIRVLIVDYNSDAGNLIFKHSNKPDALKADFEAAIDHARDIEGRIKKDINSKGAIEFRLTSWIPSCLMTIIKYPDNEGVADISIKEISIKRQIRGRRSITLKRSEYISDFDYFSNQFEALWEDDSYPLTFDGKKN